MAFWAVVTSVPAADPHLDAAEHRALIAAANYQSAYLLRANVQLIAPEPQRQIQNLADEISVAAGSDRRFRVFIVNDGFSLPHSIANGDIFLPTGYLDMVADRDELAFGLAREIGMQLRDVALKEMRQQLLDAHRTNRMNTMFSILVNGAIGGLYGMYALRPIENGILRNTATPMLVGIKMVNPSAPNGVSRGPGGLIGPPSPMGPQAQGVYMSNPQDVGSAKDATGIIGQFVGWVPNLISSKTLAVTSHLVSVAYEDADPQRRRLKDQLGLDFMQRAGYNSASGLKAIAKEAEYLPTSVSPNASATNAPPKELK